MFDTDTSICQWVFEAGPSVRYRIIDADTSVYANSGPCRKVEAEMDAEYERREAQKKVGPGRNSSDVLQHMLNPRTRIELDAATCCNCVLV